MDKCFALLTIMLFVFTESTGAWAARRGKIFSITTRHTTYEDLTTSSSVAEQEIEPSIDVELGLRMHSLFQFIAVLGQTQDSTIQSVGLGFRIDTPGFFWLGKKSTRQFRNGARQNPFNTSIFGYIAQNTVEDSTGVESTANGTNMGIAIDVFPWNKYMFITMQASMININSNFFSAYSAGIGAEF